MLATNPLQQVVLGTTGEDQFPIYDTDGFTPVSGVDPDDLVVTIYVDAVDVTDSYPAPTIAEIGSTGEYTISFSTPSRGRLIIDVAYATTDFHWRGFYDVGDPYVLSGQHHYGYVRDRRGNAIPSLVVEVLASGTATILATVQTDADGRYDVPLIDELSERVLVDLRFSGTTLPTWTVTGVVLA